MAVTVAIDNVSLAGALLDDPEGAAQLFIALANRMTVRQVNELAGAIRDRQNPCRVRVFLRELTKELE